MYQTNQDLVGIEKVWPIQFDLSFQSELLNHRLVTEARYVVVPCRPDTVWGHYAAKYKMPASAYCNRLRRLYEVASTKNALVVPYHKMFQPRAATAIREFLGLSKSMTFVEDEMECPWPNSPIMKRYAAVEGKMSRLGNYFETVAEYIHQ